MTKQHALRTAFGEAAVLIASMDLASFYGEDFICDHEKDEARLDNAKREVVSWLQKKAGRG